MAAGRPRWSPAAGCATTRARTTGWSFRADGRSRPRWSSRRADGQTTGRGYNSLWMRAVSALMFFPRGGSAHVARALAHGLPANGWDVTVVSGSKHSGHCDAERFYGGLDVVSVDFDAG